MIRRPPRSTLFPYTSSSDLSPPRSRSRSRFPCTPATGCSSWGTGNSASWTSTRSEEHTSELQSRLHLVCRLLLEKKKNTQPDQPLRGKHQQHCPSLDLASQR